MPKGQCHCGAVRYEMPAETIHKAICHCSDCRRHSGAPMVAWGLVEQGPAEDRGRDQGICLVGDMGGGISARNAEPRYSIPMRQIFPGQIDVQTATLDDPDEIAPDDPSPGGRADRLDGAARPDAGIRALSGLIGRLARTPRRMRGTRHLGGVPARELRLTPDIPVIHRL